MTGTDSIGDMLTRIRNAHSSEHEVTELPHSRIKEEIVRVMKKEGFVSDYVVEGTKAKKIRVYLKYGDGREPAVRGLRRESRPGHRRYVRSEGIPLVLGGMGVAILSTSKGIMTGKDARKQQLGGELLCTVW
jgi:small subunit ribosomal protein S8